MCLAIAGERQYAARIVLGERARRCLLLFAMPPLCDSANAKMAFLRHVPRCLRQQFWRMRIERQRDFHQQFIARRWASGRVALLGCDALALAQFAPSRCRDQLPKRPVMQSPGITLSFHREMADASRKLVGPDGSAAVTLESYPRFIEGGFQHYQGLGIKRSITYSKHVPSVRSRLWGNKVFWSFH
jgi:hypothetical protein